jgi:hypothetical protein
MSNLAACADTKHRANIDNAIFMRNIFLGVKNNKQISNSQDGNTKQRVDGV